LSVTVAPFDSSEKPDLFSLGAADFIKKAKRHQRFSDAMTTRRAISNLRASALFF
jgi:hypothetical protein